MECAPHILWKELINVYGLKYNYIKYKSSYAFFVKDSFLNVTLECGITFNTVKLSLKKKTAVNHMWHPIRGCRSSEKPKKKKEWREIWDSCERCDN